MNYRHSFHAGNFADVHKHVALLALLRHLHKKDSPFFFLDTHAGRGFYDLRAAEATRSGEWQFGIGRIVDKAAVGASLVAYLQMLRSFQPNAATTVVHYPGSPLLAAAMLRANDRAVLVEKNPTEAMTLKENLRQKKRISVLIQDGYEALKAHLPPKENRGLVLMDPPFETETEFTDLSRALQFALTRWPNGMHCIWYPIKLGDTAHRWQQSLINAGLKKLLLLELNIRPSDSPVGLNGSGLLVVNPPWQFDVEFKTVQTELLQWLAPDGTGGTRVSWLAGE